MCAASMSRSLTRGASGNSPTLFASISTAAARARGTFYAFSDNVAGALEIAGISLNPFDWGLPNLSLPDLPAFRIRTRHSLAIRPIHSPTTRLELSRQAYGALRQSVSPSAGVNTESDGNPRGTFVFNGDNTSPGGQQVTGSNTFGGVMCMYFVQPYCYAVLRISVGIKNGAVFVIHTYDIRPHHTHTRPFLHFSKSRSENFLSWMNWM